MKKFSKENFMKIFIGIAIPMISGIIYDIVMKIFNYSDIIGIIYGIVFLYIWYRYGKYLSKNKIEYKKALFGTHSLIIIGTIFAVISVIFYPSVSSFIEIIAMYANLYVVSIQSLTSPLILILTYAYEIEVYGIYLNLNCVLALISMMGIFTVGYDKFRRD